MESTTLATSQPSSKPGLLQKFGEKYSIDTNRVLTVVKNTVFRASKQEDELSIEETQAAMIVCEQYDLNPFTKEIWAFKSRGKLLIVVSIDGWCTLINRQKELNGIEFEEHFQGDKIHAITCKIHRKDRAIPTAVTEYWTECKRETDPWRNSPIRMLRHRALIQCARIAFSISGALDEDEGERMLESAGPLIEQREAGSEEAEALMAHLNWNEGQKASARAKHRGNMPALVEYLRGMKQKTARVTRKAEPAPPPITVEVMSDEDSAAEDEEPTAGEYINAQAQVVEQPQQHTAQLITADGSYNF